MRESNEEIVLFRCTKCGKLSTSLGWLHGHVEKHRGYTWLKIQLPFTKTSPGDFDRLMDYTEVIQVTDYDSVELEDVEVSS